MVKRLALSYIVLALLIGPLLHPLQVRARAEQQTDESQGQDITITAVAFLLKAAYRYASLQSADKVQLTIGLSALHDSFTPCLNLYSLLAFLLILVYSRKKRLLLLGRLQLEGA